MSKFGATITVPLALADALAVCKEACSHGGWRVIDGTSTSLRCTEAQTNAFGFTNPVQATVSLRSDGRASTTLEIHGSNYGFGPIQSRHVRTQVEGLGQRIVMEASAPRSASPVLFGGMAVHVNGRPLGEAELNTLRQVQGAVPPPGRYWYDPVCGAWGLEGGPQRSIAAAGMRLGGPLAANASNGTTGVFINGRQLHLQDVAILRSLVGVVLPGRWWVDARGNFGMEGGPMIGNLFAIVQSRMAGASGGSSGSSGRYGTLVSDGAACYFQGSIGSGISGSTG